MRRIPAASLKTIDLTEVRDAILGPGQFEKCTILFPQASYNIVFSNAALERCELRAASPKTVELNLLEARVRSCSLVGCFEDATFGSIGIHSEWPPGEVQALDVSKSQLHACRFYSVPPHEVRGFSCQSVGVVDPIRAANALADPPQWLELDLERVADDEPSLTIYAFDLVLAAAEAGRSVEHLVGADLCRVLSPFLLRE